MENIKIVVNKQTRMIQSISKSVIGNDGENLQENLVFSFDDQFVNGQARLELEFADGTKNFINLIKINETYQIPVKSVMTIEGRIYMQLVIDEGIDENAVPIFKSNVFYMLVNPSILAVGEAPDGYQQWIDLANTKLNEIDNLNIQAVKVGNVATITITKKDGTEESVQIFDGVGLQFNWVGTSLGVKRENETDYQYVNLQGPPGAPGSIKMVIVNQLPETGEEGTLYFVPKTPDTSDLYDEYVWINNAWELLGEKQITVDLTDYVKNTDYAKSNIGGVVKIFNAYGISINNSGELYARNYNYSAYQNANDNNFVGKGTLENVITGKGLLDSSKVKNTYSTTSGEIYDVIYINGLIGDINTILATLTTPSNNGGGE